MYLQGTLKVLQKHPSCVVKEEEEKDEEEVFFLSNNFFAFSSSFQTKLPQELP